MRIHSFETDQKIQSSPSRKYPEKSTIIFFWSIFLYLNNKKYYFLVIQSSFNIKVLFRISRYMPYLSVMVAQACKTERIKPYLFRGAAHSSLMFINSCVFSVEMRSDEAAGH